MLAQVIFTITGPDLINRVTLEIKTLLLTCALRSGGATAIISEEDQHGLLALVVAAS